MSSRRLLKEEGSTQVNIVINDKDKIFAFKLEKSRKFDYSIFKSIKNKDYVKKISF